MSFPTVGSPESTLIKESPFKTKNSFANISKSYTKIYYQTDGRDIEQEPKGFNATKSINYGESTLGFVYDEATKDITTTTITEDLTNVEPNVTVASADNVFAVSPPVLIPISIGQVSAPVEWN